MKKIKPKTKFQKFLMIYFIVLTILMFSFLIYVTNSLVMYENNQIDNYIILTLKDLEKSSEKGELSSVIENTNKKSSSKYESEDVTIEDCLKSVLKDRENITYKQKDESNSVFELYYKNLPLLELGLKVSKRVNRLGLLTFSLWKVDYLKSIVEDGIYSYDIEVPSSYRVTINGHDVSEGDLVYKDEEDGLLEISKYTEIPILKKYKIKGLFAEPTIEVFDENDNKIKYILEDSKITMGLNVEKITNFDKAKERIENIPDIMKIAEDWSLFLSKDLNGALYGYYVINKYLIDGSSLSKYAYNWATGVDITFTSSHTLNNPPFTDETVENFEIYSKDAFSCEIHLVKHMNIKGGKKLDDEMHERMYFVRQSHEWKLVNMKSIKEGDTKNE